MGDKCPRILPKNSDFHVTFRDLLHAVKLRQGTEGFTSPPKEGVLRIFFSSKKSAASAGCEPANLDIPCCCATERFMVVFIRSTSFDSIIKKSYSRVIALRLF